MRIIKYSGLTLLYGLVKFESMEATSRIDKNCPASRTDEKPPNTEDEKKPRNSVLGILGIFLKYGLIIKEVVDVVKNYLGGFFN